LCYFSTLDPFLMMMMICLSTSVSNSIPKHISSTFFFDSLLPSGSMCVGLPRDQPTGEKPTQKNPQKNPKKAFWQFYFQILND